MNKQAANQLEARTLRQWAGRKTAKIAVAPDAKTSVITAQPAPPAKRLPFAAGVTVSDPGKRHRTKLCRDLKGLFTPCVK